MIITLSDGSKIPGEIICPYCKLNTAMQHDLNCLNREIVYYTPSAVVWHSAWVTRTFKKLPDKDD